MAKKLPKLNTREKVNKALLQLGKIEIRLKEKENEMNAEKQDLIDKYTALTEKDLIRYKNLTSEIKAYCNYYKNDFEKKGILKVQFGKYGFRQNPAKVVLLSKKWNWEKVVDRAKDLFKKKYIHTEEKFNKELAITLYSEDKLKDEDLTAMGIKITKGKTFVCEPDWIEIKKLELSN